MGQKKEVGASLLFQQAATAAAAYTVLKDKGVIDKALRLCHNWYRGGGKLFEARSVVAVRFIFFFTECNHVRGSLLFVQYRAS